MDKHYTDIILRNVMGSYVYVVEPKKESGDNSDDGEKDKYSMQIIMPKDHPQIKMLNQKIKSHLKLAFGEKALEKISRFKLPLRDGEKEGKEGDQYVNSFFFGTNSKDQPGIVNKYNMEPSKSELRDWCYSGAMFNVSITLFNFPRIDKGKPGIGVYIQNVMMLHEGGAKHGKGSKKSAMETFADLACEPSPVIDDFEEDEWEDAIEETSSEKDEWGDDVPF